MKHDENTLSIFNKITEALRELSSDDLKKISDPLYKIEIKLIRKIKIKSELIDKSDNEDVEFIVKTLIEKPSRSDAHYFLETRYPSKKSLEIIARHLDIPIIRQDKIENLKEKIVEATVGARIRSTTIQGPPD